MCQTDLNEKWSLVTEMKSCHVSFLNDSMIFLSRRYDDVFEESMARFYLAEMVVAVHALHTMGYVHR